MSGAFSHVLRIDRVPPRGTVQHLQASAEERPAIAAALGIEAVEALDAELTVRLLPGDAVAVRGRVTASVVQTDVVTLDPVRQEVAEEVDLTLVPEEERRGRRQKEEEAGPQAERDVFRNGEIDLGTIVVEHLALGLDPYPRAPGVEFSPHVEDDSGDGESPFAALQRLKRERR